jgi:hypothetical protein
MKPMAFNLKDAKKIAGDKHSSTFSLKNGHKIVVAHAPLPALQRKQLEKMPVHLAEAGMVEGKGDDASGQLPDWATKPGYQAIQENLQDNNKPQIPQDVAQAALSDPNSPLAKDYPDELKKATQFYGIGQPDAAPMAAENQGQGPTMEAAPQSAAAPAAPMSDTAAQAPGMAAMAGTGGVDLSGAYAQGQRGISEAEQVAKQNAAANIQTQQDDLNARKQLLDNFQKNATEMRKHQMDVLNDYANNHIDPKHYLQDMGTGQKIATAIGLLLGGFTGGFNKTGVNPAEQWLQEQQNRDIEAQKASMDQKKTLFGAYREMYNDDTLAEQATRASMNDFLNHEIQLQASKTGSLAAKAAADQAHSQFTFQNGQLLQSMAIRKSVLDASKNGGAGVTPLALGHAGFINPEQAQKEQAALDAYKANMAAGNQTFSNLAKLQTAGTRLANPVQSGQQIAAENAKLASIVQAANPSERLTPESAKLEIEPYMLNLRDNADTVASKQKAFQDHLWLKYAGQLPATMQYAPASIPRYQGAGSSLTGSIPVGARATNQKTGQSVVWNGRAWVSSAR